MNPIKAPPAVGPGQQLRQARVDTRLSVEDVARALQLSARHIAAIERDDYEQLPAATYVRGYLRAYAQLVGLAPERVLETFNQLPIANRRQGLVPPAPATQITSNDGLIKLGTLAVAGVMIGLAIVWWQGQEPASAPSTAAVPPVALVPDTTPVTPMVDTETETAAPAPAARAPTPSPTAPRAAAPSTPPERPAQVISPRVPSDTPAVDIDPNTPRSRLVLYVTDDSWAEVRDARSQRLIYETVAAGRVVTLEGVAPFQVFLGNADGVRVEMNGRAFDVLRHKRGQVARFTLGEGATPPASP